MHFANISLHKTAIRIESVEKGTGVWGLPSSFFEQNCFTFVSLEELIAFLQMLVTTSVNGLTNPHLTLECTGIREFLHSVNRSHYSVDKIELHYFRIFLDLL